MSGAKKNLGVQALTQNWAVVDGGSIAEIPLARTPANVGQHDHLYCST
jgi:hypothetical protein